MKLLLAAFQPRFQVVEVAPGVFQVEPHILPGSFVVGEPDVTIRPEVDFLGQTLVDGSKGFVHVGNPSPCHFIEVLGHQSCRGQRECPLFQAGSQPRGGQHLRQQRTLPAAQGFKVQVGSPTGEARAAVGLHAHELEALGYDLPVAGFHFVGDEEKQGRLVAVVGRIDQNGSLPKQVDVLFQQHVGCGHHQRVSGMDQAGERQARFFHRANRAFSKADALVAFKYRH